MLCAVKSVSIYGSPRRCGGQGDILSGRQVTIYDFQHILLEKPFSWCLMVSGFVIKGWLSWVLASFYFSCVCWSLLFLFLFLLYILPSNIMPFLNPLFGSCKEMRERKLKCSMRWWMIQTDESVSRTQNLIAYKVFMYWSPEIFLTYISSLLVPVLQYFYFGLVNIFQLQKGICISGL